MAFGLNRLEVIGHTGGLPEMRATQDNLSVANFSVAVNSTAKGEDTTEWFKVVAFGKLAEICKNILVSKGMMVYVAGPVRSRAWTNKDGSEGHSTEIIARDIIKLDKKEVLPPAQDRASGGGPAPGQDGEPGGADPYDRELAGDDLPF